MHHPVTTLGPGRRVGLWVQGCTLACAGCISQDTWTTKDGALIEVARLAATIAGLVDEHDLDGVTISGGEPFQQAMPLRHLLEELRERVAADVDLLVYSGYRWSQLREFFSDVVALADAVISEPFIADRPPVHAWVGSGNQQIHAVSLLGAVRYANVPLRVREMQCSVEGGRVWLTGIPRQGDMELFERAMRDAGVELGGLSWRS